MLTVKQAATHAGVSESLIYVWCGDGTLPHVRMGRKGKRGTIRIAVDDLNGVIAAFKVCSAPVVSVPAASGSPALPFCELNPQRLAKAWKPR
ncbi:helix-turn-helix domain-containing protein [Limnoglobus roseus]|uniref:DNA-binding protein n=1 Tax=Limnoglobus roseus TaxID=2598579 RepID=A0A5C1AGW8_9BACT|nr:DNA-binding protein [Limnoglobus roseus]